jgi:chromosome segregation ATPase
MLFSRHRPVAAEERLGSAIDAIREEMMDFSERLDALEQRVAAAKAAAQTASTESREQIGKRIDQAQVELDRTVKDAQQQADQAADTARTAWAQMRADAAAKIEDVKAKIGKRTRQLDAKAAARDADWADVNAADAIDFAEWAVDNAELAILDAIDAHAYADERTKAAGS